MSDVYVLVFVSSESEHVYICAHSNKRKASDYVQMEFEWVVNLLSGFWELNPSALHK